MMISNMIGNVCRVIRRDLQKKSILKTVRVASQLIHRQCHGFVQLLEMKIEKAENFNTHVIFPAMYHAVIIKHGFSNDQITGKMIRLYSNTGNTNEGGKMFNESVIDGLAGLAVWNSQIANLGIHGEGVRAINTFVNMPARIKKTVFTYWSILVACSHSGEIEFANYTLGKVFKSFGEPNIELFCTYIDALARSGRLEEAFEEVKYSIYAANEEMISSILDRCKPELMNKTSLASEFVKFLEEQDICYRVELALAGVVWKENVSLKSKKKGSSTVQN